MALASSKGPLGISLVQYIYHRKLSYGFYQAFVFVLTFIAYSLYHLARKPSSIVKNTFISTGLHGTSLKASRSIPLLDQLNSSSARLGFSISQLGPHQIYGSTHLHIDPSRLRGWAPFDGDSGTGLLGDIDVAFLAVYAVGTFFAGHLGDRVCLRWLLTAGMLGSGVFSCLFGLAYWWDVHWLPYFFIVQMLSGLFQATGWPSVVTVVANWFGKRKRGLIMGLWNAHTSLGNICGSLIASSVLGDGWGWSFVVPGFAIISGGVVIFFFLVVDPAIVSLTSPDIANTELPESSHGNSFYTDEESLLKKGFVDGYHFANEEREKISHGKLVEDEISVPLLVDYSNEKAGSSYYEEGVHAVSFLEALSIPGVVPFACCLFFAKLVAYTFIYWLPFYISNTEIGGMYMSDEMAGNLSTLFDVGGVVGGVVAGHMSDKLNARATTAVLFTYAAIPAMALYRAFGSSSLHVNIGLLLMVGLFVNGPYALITTAVSADLGTHVTTGGGAGRSNARALATVTAIIDGTGSLGAAVGPLITGYISEALGWNSVFGMLTLSAFISGFLLTKEVSRELKSTTRLNLHHSY